MEREKLQLPTVRCTSGDLHTSSKSNRTKGTMRSQSNIVSLSHDCYSVKFAYSTTVGYLIVILKYVTIVATTDSHQVERYQPLYAQNRGGSLPCSISVLQGQ